MPSSFVKGILTTADTLDLLGHIQKIDFDDKADEVTFKNKVGNTAYHDFADGTIEISGTVVMDRSAAIPARGDIVVIAASLVPRWNGKYKVISVKGGEENTKHPEVTITMRRYVDGGIPAQS